MLEGVRQSISPKLSAPRSTTPCQHSSLPDANGASSSLRVASTSGQHSSRRGGELSFPESASDRLAPLSTRPWALRAALRISTGRCWRLPDRHPRCARRLQFVRPQKHSILHLPRLQGLPQIGQQGSGDGHLRRCGSRKAYRARPYDHCHCHLLSVA